MDTEIPEHIVDKHKKELEPMILEEKTPDKEDSVNLNSLSNLSHYERYFTVTTDQVVKRLVWSMFPKRGLNFFEDLIRSEPDLYGPIWICVTLIMTLTISGNLVGYLDFSSRNITNTKWEYNFHLISVSSTFVLCYCLLVPLILWATLKWNLNERLKITYLELICLYGYSMTIFIPVSIIWVIRNTCTQMSFAFVGTVLSGIVLIKSIFPLISKQNNYSYGFVMFCCHLLLPLILLYNCYQKSKIKPTVKY